MICVSSWCWKCLGARILSAQVFSKSPVQSPKNVEKGETPAAERNCLRRCPPRPLIGSLWVVLQAPIGIWVYAEKHQNLMAIGGYPANIGKSCHGTHYLPNGCGWNIKICRGPKRQKDLAGLWMICIDLYLSIFIFRIYIRGCYTYTHIFITYGLFIWTPSSLTASLDAPHLLGPAAP